MRIAFAILALSLLLFPLGAKAHDYYVSPAGSDQHSGAKDAPWLTIAHAVRHVEPGDQIIVRAGTYAGGVVIETSGTPHAWITLRAYPGEHVVLQGAGHEEDVYFYNSAMRPAYWKLEGLDLTGGDDYVVKIDVPDVQLIGNNLHASHDDIVKMVRTASHILVENNRIHDNAARPGANAQGIDIVGANDVLVRGNVVYRIPSLGMFAKGGAHNVVFSHNIVRQVADRGIQLGQSTGKQFMRPGDTYETYNCVVRRNTIIDAGSACLGTASSLNPKIYDNYCDNVAQRETAGIFVSNESELGQAGTNVSIHNNVIILGGDRPAVEIAPHAMTNDHSLRIDHNLYWAPGGPSAVGFSWSRAANEGQPSVYSLPLSRWTELTGLDRHSEVAAPTVALERRILGFSPPDQLAAR